MSLRILLAVLAVLLGIALWWLIEPYTTVEPQASQQKPRAAANQLLAKRDIDTRILYGPAPLFPLPDTDTLLVFSAQRTHLGEENIALLHEWVRAGGRLLIEARTLYYHEDEDDCDDEDCADDTQPDAIDEEELNYAETGYDYDDLEENDPLLYSFGVSAWRVPRDDIDPPLAPFRTLQEFEQAGRAVTFTACLSPSGSERDNCLNWLCGDDTVTPTYSLAYVDGTAHQFAFDPEKKLMHRDQYADELADDEQDPELPLTETRIRHYASNDYGDQFLILDYGDGDIVVMTDLSIWDNDSLGYLDHAWLLDALSDGSSAVWWIQNISMPPLSAWLWQRAWPLLVSLALLFALFLWLRMPRRGVMLQNLFARRRDFLHHLHASAFFLWRTGEHQALLLALRQQVLRKLSRHARSDDMKASAAAAASLTGLTAEQVEMALLATPQSRHEFTFVIQILQTLRSRL